MGLPSPTLSTIPPSNPNHHHHHPHKTMSKTDKIITLLTPAVKLNETQIAWLVDDRDEAISLKNSAIFKKVAKAFYCYPRLAEEDINDFVRSLSS